MAVQHCQFESIHPFYDGNGRTGRILNVLYLVKSGLLDSPILYLSDYIIKNKNDYYCTREQGKKELTKATYSKELMELIFIQPCTKIDFLILKSYKSWKETIYINTELFELLKTL